MSKNEVNVALIGFGTIGAGVVDIFNKNRDLISKKVGKEVYLKKVADLDLTTDRGVEVPEGVLTDDTMGVLADENIDIIIELIGGYEPARTFIIKALESGKDVVTANKALVAKYWEELQEVAAKNNRRLAFEASVGGGIPVLLPLNEMLASNKIQSIYGIMNGTGNYILTKMAQEGLEFHTVLKEAQELGYAEADPTFDIEGHDTAQKLIILTKLGFGEYVPQEKFLVEGITKVTPKDLDFANETGYVIKLLGISQIEDGQLEIRVHPTLVPKDYLISSVNDVFNAIHITGDFLGPAMLYGQGAGRNATASAVVGDCIDLIINPNKRIDYGPAESQVKKVKTIPEITCKYYLRVNTTQTLKQLKEILESNNTVVNVSRESGNDKYLITRKTTENNIDKVKKILEKEANSLNIIRILSA